MRMHFPLATLGLVVGLAMGPAQAAGDFAIDLSKFTYQYASTTHALDFAVSGDFVPPLPVDPATGWSLIWEPSNRDPAHPEFGGSAFWTSNSWRLSVPQSTQSSPESVRAGTAINGLGGFPPPNGPPPLDWQVTANIVAIAGANVSGTLYKIEMGGGTFDPAGPNLHVNAYWYSGEFQGITYANALLLESDLAINGYTWESSTGPDAFLANTDPATTLLDLRVEISEGGQTFSSFYRLNGGSEWNLAHRHTLPLGVGALAGFPNSHPYIAISNEIAAVPEPQMSALFLVGLTVLGWLSRRKV